MKKSIIVLAMFLACCKISAQVGIGIPSPNASAILDLNSTTKGLLSPRLTTAQRNAIVSPAAGLIIYNTTKKCLEWYTGTVWYNGCGNQDGEPSSGGSAVVSAYSCTKDSKGTLEVGIEASGVTQTITASVDKIGTYAISAIANGVTFSGSGTFSETGSQDIVLTASGVLTFAGATNYVLNTTPGCSFTRATVNSTSGGTAIVTSYDCTELTDYDTFEYKSVLVEGLKAEMGRARQSITAIVAATGTYDISTTTANGLIFSGSGTFSKTGSQIVYLKAKGVPVVSGNHSFTLKTTPSCSFNRSTIASSDFTAAICDGSSPTVVVPITTSTGKTWMDRNLGASRQATSPWEEGIRFDYKAYGCMYQWGRGNDGHASMKWYSSFDYATPINGTTVSLSTTDIPGHSSFILGGSKRDWRLETNSDLWQGVNGVNNPCPTGYRIPTIGEIEEEFKFSDNPLKFAGAGFRSPDTGLIDNSFERSFHHSSSSLTVRSKLLYTLVFGRLGWSADHGAFVRCIKD
jgi:hypothetical protein